MFKKSAILDFSHRNFDISCVAVESMAVSTLRIGEYANLMSREIDALRLKVCRLPLRARSKILGLQFIRQDIRMVCLRFNEHSKNDIIFKALETWLNLEGDQNEKSNHANF